MNVGLLPKLFYLPVLKTRHNKTDTKAEHVTDPVRSGRQIPAGQLQLESRAQGQAVCRPVSVPPGNTGQARR